VSETFAGQRTGDHFANGLLVGRGVGFDRARLTGLVRTQDIGPTVLDFFGVQAPASCEGQSVMQLLKAHS
jgi:predicted AlkP superfamily phosphohydrolase/phosphomutase